MNHFDIRIVRLNSLLDVLAFFGPVSPSASADNEIIVLGLILILLRVSHSCPLLRIRCNKTIDLCSCDGGMEVNAFAKARAEKPAMMHLRLNEPIAR